MAKQHEIYQKDEKVSFAARLQRMVKLWQKKNKAVWKHQNAVLELWASGFFDSMYDREHLINLIDRGVYSIVPYLVEGNPKIMVTSKIANMKPRAFATQLALNFLLDKMEFADNVLIPAATNSMFGAGITRTFREYDRKITLDDEIIKIGTPVVKVIHDTNYIGDPIAKTRSDFVFEGDIYKLPTDYAKDLFAGKDSFGNQIADYIEADCKLIHDFSPDKIVNPNDIHTPDFNPAKHALRDYSTFIDIYMYDTNKIITIMPEGKKAKILREVESDGPWSPYDYVGYKFFPECSVPLPPAWGWHDQDVSMNIVAKTAREQAESQKDLIAASANNKKLLKDVANAKNMDVMLVTDPENIKQLSFGGMNQQNLPWMGFVETAFNKSGGTAEIMSGRGAEAPTLGQEKLQFANASRLVNNWYNRWHRFMTSIVRKVSYLVWTDPTTYVPMVHEIPGVGELPVVFSAPDEVEDYYNFIFEVIPYSTQRTSPDEMFQKIMLLMSQWILPTYQFAAQQGAELDVPAVTGELADYLGIETFNQWYKTALPKQLDGIGYTMQPNKNKNQFNQMNDTFGKTDVSATANMMQQQARTGVEGTA